MNKPIPTQPPPSPLAKHLQEQFAADIVKQNERLDELAKQLFTLELAIPGLYVTALKLMQGDSATLPHEFGWVPFVFWLLALLATMVGLFPLNYEVDLNVIRHNHKEPSFWRGLSQWFVHHFKKPTQTLSIEEFYRESAQNKRYALLLGSVCFFIGIFSAGLLIFI